MEKDSPLSNRKRPRENETPSQRLKREKAAERQRRKRERDRANSGLGPPPMPFAAPPDQHYPHHHQPPPPEYLPAPNPPPNDDNLSPDEQARRERVRAAARERQRKHRQLVKQRKMRELGLDMGNEIMPGMDEVHYRVNAEGQYQQLMPHEMQAQVQAQAAHQHHLAQQAAQAHAQGQPPQGEPPFPQGPAHGGQTFATTLLLSFSCAPLLKQHLLRTLNMTNDELASLEPIIAEAWDRWDQGRRIRYEQEQQGFPPGPVPGPGDPSQYPPPPNGEAYPPPYPTDDFRGRFQRVMTVPAPFRSSFNSPAAPGEGGADTPSSASGAGSVNGAAVDAIDPHLGGKDSDGLLKSES
ncbi:hypothetical protein C8R43DRAFT_1233899 [Mycena crocata]|nr:hypothetical protein C8R43DRAFT_1233899 [Mycena crocata]